MAKEKINVISSHGYIFVDRDTGKIIDNNTDGEYDSISRFDLEEWKEYWQEELPYDFDILDLGGWDKDGGYFHAEESFREQVRKDKAS